LHGALDALARDLVESQALHGHLGLEHLEQVPGDGLSLAVLIGGEVDLLGVLELGLDLGDDLALLRADHIVGLEAVLDVHRELAHGALALAWGQLAGLRKVADVADARHHVVLRTKERADGARLRGRLDDHELARHGTYLYERRWRTSGAGTVTEYIRRAKVRLRPSPARRTSRQA
jgi:hypothetical protein